ncbi:hypothetical protein P5673_004344 [Acropora cervicornis]|uniref:Uncharacterized protein n=1 Tax=Acropora cervicornis TaxID=6130 RepID=A0AAD9R017_ACRCE|nr:hypothetical protein P5673_004344 [Acropora cervicornis]
MAHQTVDLKEREAFLAAWMIGTKLLHRRLEKSFKKSIHYFEHTRAGHRCMHDWLLTLIREARLNNAGRSANMGRRIERLNIFLGPNELICIPEYNILPVPGQHLRQLKSD